MARFFYPPLSPGQSFTPGPQRSMNIQSASEALGNILRATAQAQKSNYERMLMDKIAKGEDISDLMRQRTGEEGVEIGGKRVPRIDQPAEEPTPFLGKLIQGLARPFMTGGEHYRGGATPTEQLYTQQRIQQLMPKFKSGKEQYTAELGKKIETGIATEDEKTEYRRMIGTLRAEGGREMLSQAEQMELQSINKKIEDLTKSLPKAKPSWAPGGMTKEEIEKQIQKLQTQKDAILNKTKNQKEKDRQELIDNGIPESEVNTFLKVKYGE